MKNSRLISPKASSSWSPEHIPLISPNRFKFSKFIYLPLCLLYCFFCVWIGIQQKAPSIIWIGAIGSLAFIFIFYFLNKSKNSKINLYANKITLKKGKGPLVSMPWGKIDRIREQVGGGALILTKADSNLKIRIPLTIDHFDRVRERILNQWDEIPVIPGISHNLSGISFSLYHPGFKRN